MLSEQLGCAHTWCRRLGLLTDETEEMPESQQMIEVKANKETSFKQTEQLMAAVFLEGGIVFHSIFVGINYGVTDDGTQGVPVMVALIFHQASLLSNCSMQVELQISTGELR